MHYLFRAFGRFLDGGLIANNPTLDALTEIHEHCLALKAKGKENESCPVSVVVSLGTGLIPVTQIKEIDVFRPESIWDSAKLVIGISALGTLLVDQVRNISRNSSFSNPFFPLTTKVQKLLPV